MGNQKLLEKMQQRLQQLRMAHEKQKADVHAIEGAIQEAEFWINDLEQEGDNYVESD